MRLKKVLEMVGREQMSRLSSDREESSRHHMIKYEFLAHVDYHSSYLMHVHEGRGPRFESQWEQFIIL